MRTISIKLPEDLDRKLSTLAKRQHTSRSAVVREALEAYAQRQPPTLLELAGDLVGCIHGPTDLATSETYMEGYGE